LSYYRFGKTLFIQYRYVHLNGDGFEGEGFENMEEIGYLEEQALRSFCKSFTKRYEQWKRGNLLAVALETMPKQVNRGKVLDNLLKLYSARAESSET
jgi:hypothetical protein